ncbi:PPOX class F420-dependent oxidoreductase [Nonomuraea sp. NPDC050691]|uniref:PPOX class F420-dependent oxidoreductase n=1 Tax=Nonomuraea sp. NPDC050691 TaxID=3155661 RepID=UPI0033FD5057
MSRQEAIDFLVAGTRTGKLATASSSGAPHVAPLWFVLDGDDLVFTTGRGSVKGRHLRANPRAALTVDREEFPYAFVTVRGPVRVEQAPDDLLAWTTRLAERYVPSGQAEEYGRRNLGPTELLCRLGMERIIGIDGVAL